MQAAERAVSRRDWLQQSLALLGCGVAPCRHAAADTAPLRWANLDGAANLADPVHALMARIVRERQLNPLRAARLFAGVRVAQAEARRQLPSAGTAGEDWAALRALTWLLPQEAAARWIGPGLLRLHAAGMPRGDDAALLDAAVVPVLAALLGDGSDARRRSVPRPEPVPGRWQRTPPLFAEQPIEPQAASWRPWCDGTLAADVPAAVAHGSERWHAEVRQVLDTHRALTAEQRDIAQRWHLDAGSVTPPGVWNAIALMHLAQEPLEPLRRARLLALLNMAMLDALIAAWRVKLRDWSERPMTAVRRERDAAFTPLLVTPPFPGYVSGHACVSAAAAGVLSHFVPRQAAAWQALAQEAALSRLYGGIHFASDNDAGLDLGAQVAAACLKQFEPAGRSQQAPLVTAPAGMPVHFFDLPRMHVTPAPAAGR